MNRSLALVRLQPRHSGQQIGGFIAEIPSGDCLPKKCSTQEEGKASISKSDASNISHLKKIRKLVKSAKKIFRFRNMKHVENIFSDN